MVRSAPILAAGTGLEEGRDMQDENEAEDEVESIQDQRQTKRGTDRNGEGIYEAFDVWRPREDKRSVGRAERCWAACVGSYAN